MLRFCKQVPECGKIKDFFLEGKGKLLDISQAFSYVPSSANSTAVSRGYMDDTPCSRAVYISKS